MNIHGENCKNICFGVVGVFVSVCVLLYFVSLEFDTKWKRQQTSKHLSLLGQRASVDPKAIDEIIKYLDSDYEFGQMYACTVLREIAPKRQDVLEALISKLEFARPSVQSEAALAIGALGEYSAPAVELLMKKLNPQNRRTAWFSAEALGNIGLPANAAIPALERAKKHSGVENMRDAASRALEKLNKFNHSGDIQLEDN
jgi:HEAT repeat protein